MLLRFILIILIAFTASSCGRQGSNTNDIFDVYGYKQITQAEAKAIIDSGDSYILLDVRTQEEYDEQRIPGALLIPVADLEEAAERELPDKDAVIMIYCQTGIRSVTASEILVDLGYVNVFEIGGIITWEYETE